MPELPEVETTVRGLQSKVVGHTIRDFWCDHPRMIRYISPKAMAKLVIGRKVVAARRRAKHIIVDLSGGKSLIAHMKMTGHFLYGKYFFENGKWKAESAGPLRDDPYNRFVHAVFTLNKNVHLAFSDTRKFGKIAIHDTKDLERAKELENLGPELWEISAIKFAEIISRKKGKIKQVLMDQQVLAGVGNIYSDEGLWAASIHPLSQPSKIPKPKLQKLFAELVKVTKRSLKTGGDSMSDYRNLDGVGGKFQNFHKAYRQTSKACTYPKCKGKIERIVVGARSTHYCPLHQILYK